jgi:hypothetical protein
VLAARASSQAGDGGVTTGGGPTVPTPFGQIHTDWGSPLVVAPLLLLVLAGAALIARSFRRALR